MSRDTFSLNCRRYFWVYSQCICPRRKKFPFPAWRHEFHTSSECSLPHRKHAHILAHSRRAYKPRNREHIVKGVELLKQYLEKDLKQNSKNEERPQTPDAAWKSLEDGNKRFVGGNLLGYLEHIALEISPEFRQELSTGQHPFAAVLTCSDSRVSPELIFDKGLGDLFVIRNAGNVVDPVVLGSLEYAVANLKVPLIVVMCHQCCGAVTAACTGGASRAEKLTNLGPILQTIRPAAEQALCEHRIDDEKTICVERAIDLNAQRVRDEIMLRSPCIKEAVDSGAVKIMVVKYFLSNGTVELL